MEGGRDRRREGDREGRGREVKEGNIDKRKT